MKLKQEEIKLVLNKIETTLPVNNWKSSDIEIWPLIRIRLWFDLAYKALDTKTSDSILYESKLSQIIRVFCAPFQWLYHSLIDYKKTYFSIPEGDVFVLGDGVSFAKIDEKYYDKFSDSIALLFNNEGVKTVRADTTNTFYKPRFISSYFIQPVIDIIIAKGIIMSMFKKKEIQLDKYESLYPMVEKYGVTSILEKSLILSRAIKIHQIALYFERMLRKKKFRAAMSVCYYADIGLALNLACKRIGIPSYDIQHGVQGDNHGAYGSWLNVPAKGYSLLPNFFLCWSELEQKSIQKWSHNISNHQAIVCGNMFANIWKSGKYDWNIKYAKLFHDTIKTLQPKILLTLSWDVSDEKAIHSTLKVIADTQQKYTWLIRLHPSMLSEKNAIEDMLKINNIYTYEMEITSSLPLFTILDNVDAHVTHSSSTAIEAAYFNVQSIITSEYGWALISEQIEDHFISKAYTSNQIKDSINLILTGRIKKPMKIYEKPPLINIKDLAKTF